MAMKPAPATSFTRAELARICRAFYEDPREIGTADAMILLSLAVLATADELAELRRALARLGRLAGPPPDPPEAREFLPRRAARER